MMILADTSVWIDYLRQGEPSLAEQLSQENILMHGMVLGELAIGNFKNRQLLLKQWKALPFVQTAADTQVLDFIETHQLMGKGVGWIDLHLLTAVSLAGTVQLWTRDKRLRNIAERLNLAASLL
jgi:predicted nucleic acid-binding protein